MLLLVLFSSLALVAFGEKPQPNEKILMNRNNVKTEGIYDGKMKTFQNKNIHKPEKREQENTNPKKAAPRRGELIGEYPIINTDSGRVQGAARMLDGNW